MQDNIHNIFHRKVRISLFIPLFFIFLIWIFAIVQYLFDLSFFRWGIKPRDFSKIWHILLSPLIHADWVHLWTNTLPVFLLLWGLFFFYSKIAYRIFPELYIGSGILLWSIGRDSFHLGASGIIYALAAFLFLSGLLNKNYRLTALSLIVVFLYGSLIWGILPLKNDISWEGHLSGFFVGIFCALIHRNELPKLPPPDFSEEETIPEEIWDAENQKLSNMDNEDIPL